MKYNILILTLLMTFGISACSNKPTPSQVSPAALQVTNLSPSGDQVLNTELGQFSISSVRFMDEVNGDKPGPGEKILVVILTNPEGKPLDPAAFSLEDFQTMIHDSSEGTIHILGNEGSKTISSLAGWLGPEYKEFGIGFRIPDSINTYQLIWPGNDPIEIIPGN